jgi:hypothetical protein
MKGTLVMVVHTLARVDVGGTSIHGYAFIDQARRTGRRSAYGPIYRDIDDQNVSLPVRYVEVFPFQRLVRL